MSLNWNEREKRKRKKIHYENFFLSLFFGNPRVSEWKREIRKGEKISKYFLFFLFPSTPSSAVYQSGTAVAWFLFPLRVLSSAATVVIPSRSKITGVSIWVDPKERADSQVKHNCGFPRQVGGESGRLPLVSEKSRAGQSPRSLSVS